MDNTGLVFMASCCTSCKVIFSDLVFLPEGT
jgi:hypothetical protein